MRKVKTLSREEVEATGKPLYTKYDDVPKNLHSKTTCNKIFKNPVSLNEMPAAYVLNRLYKGYLPLYKRESKESEE